MKHAFSTKLMLKTVYYVRENMCISKTEISNSQWVFKYHKTSVHLRNMPHSFGMSITQVKYDLLSLRTATTTPL